MEFASMIQAPLSSWIASILFLLRLIIVDKWKNLVFLSLSLSQSSLDFRRKIMFCSLKAIPRVQFEELPQLLQYYSMGAFVGLL